MTDIDDLSELQYGEPKIYHVAVEIDGTMYDAGGKTSLEQMGQFAMDIYGDSQPMAHFLMFDNATKSVIRQNTNWDIPWQTYYAEMQKIPFEQYLQSN